MDPAEILAAWPLKSPLVVRSLDDDTNNLSWFVATPAEEYYLRVYQNTIDPHRIAFEHALLERLQNGNLSFQVPLPMAARWGETLAQTSENGGPTFGALFRVIPGKHPDGVDLAEHTICGAALAELDEALSTVDLQPPPGMMSAPWDLSRVHASVPDPFDMVEHLPLEEAQKAHLLDIIRALSTRLPHLYDTLPWQIVHGDFDFSNVLMADDRATGVLDFEFARPDLRALDLAIALSAAGGSDWSTNRPRMVALFAGYQNRLPLAEAEIQALPDLMRHFRIGALIHREGRRRLGQARDEDVLARARALLRIDRWLREHGEEVVS